MKIKVHYPDTDQGIKALTRQVAVIHAKAVLEFIRSLPCPWEQKLLIIEEIKKAYWDAAMRG